MSASSPGPRRRSGVTTVARGRPKRAGRLGTRRPGDRLGPAPGDLVVVSRALADLAEFLSPRQEPAGRGRVVLDRRGTEQAGARAASADNSSPERRRALPEAAQALMRVLGFMVVPGAEKAAAPKRGRPRGRVTGTVPRPPAGPLRRTPRRSHRRDVPPPPGRRTRP